MFDMSWGEIMVIGGVALVVIGPKDLPRALRTVGQMTTKVRRMAGEFQSQFAEAMREAELEDVRKEVEGLNRQVSSATSTAFNPIQTIRDELRGSVEGSGSTSAPASAALPAPGDAPLPAPPVGELGHMPVTEPIDGPERLGFVEPLPPLPESGGSGAGTVPEVQPLVPLPVDEPVLPVSDPAPLVTGPGPEQTGTGSQTKDGRA